MENSMEVPQKTKTRITTWPSNSTSGLLSEENKTLTQIDMCTPMFISALFTTAKKWKQPKYPSMDGWITIHL